MVPLRKHDTPETVDEGREVSGGSVIHQMHITAHRVETPHPGIGRRQLVLIKLGIELRLSVSSPVGHKQNPSVGSIRWVDVVCIGRLIRNLGDHWSLVHRYRWT